MKTLNGVNYYSIGEVAQKIDRRPQTIKLWYKWCESKSMTIEEAGLPHFRRDLDGKKTYHFAEEDIKKLIEFRDSIAYGQMSDFTPSRWGKRGKEISARKQGIIESAEKSSEEDPVNTL